MVRKRVHQDVQRPAFTEDPYDGDPRLKYDWYRGNPSAKRELDRKKRGIRHKNSYEGQLPSLPNARQRAQNAIWGST